MLALAGAPPAASATTSTAADQILQHALDQGRGGVFGYRLAPAGDNRAPLLDQRGDHVFDPASALKALYHAYGMREVGAGRESLSDPVTRYAYPHSRNGDGDADSPYLCPDPADETPANDSARMTVADEHKRMMTISDNIATRALELRYGQDHLNAFAASLGMDDTRLDQIIGCGDDGGHVNTTTLADLGTLYAAVARGALGPPVAERSFRALMLHDQIDLSALAADEADRIGLSGVTDAFAQRVRSAFKAGSYALCASDCSSHDAVVAQAGLLTLPVVDRRGRIRARDYTWGDFVDRVTVDCFDCAADDAQFEAVGAALAEVLRPAVRQSLATWRRRLRVRLVVARGLDRVVGAVVLPAGIARDAFCRGDVTVAIRRPRAEARKLQARVKPDCTFRVRAPIAPVGERAGVRVRFAGNRRTRPASRRL